MKANSFFPDMTFLFKKVILIKWYELGEWKNGKYYFNNR
jgi:hypothetical protein